MGWGSVWHPMSSQIVDQVTARHHADQPSPKHCIPPIRSSHTNSPISTVHVNTPIKSIHVADQGSSCQSAEHRKPCHFAVQRTTGHTTPTNQSYRINSSITTRHVITPHVTSPINTMHDKPSRRSHQNKSRHPNSPIIPSLQQSPRNARIAENDPARSRERHRIPSTTQGASA